MVINHNMASQNALRSTNTNASNASKSMEKLSSGLRINRAGDDAAGLAISEKMRAQVRGLDQASSNGQDGISMIQTAEGALSETHSILQRMRELAVQASNDTNVNVDRSEIQKEMDELTKEVTRISNNTEFNTQKLINGGITEDGVGEAKFHIGANANQDITLSINAMDAKSLGISRDVASATLDAANAGGLKSAKVDSTDVTRTLADGDYQVVVNDAVAGATVDLGTSTVTAGTVGVTGAPTDSFAATFTYHAATLGTASTVASAPVMGSAAWTVNGGATNGALLNGVKINFSTAAAATANWNAGTREINVVLDVADATIADTDVTALIQGIVDADGIDFDLITATSANTINGTLAGTGTLTFGNGGVNPVADNWTTSNTSGEDFAAMYLDASATAIQANGVTIDLNAATGQTDGDSITITGGTTTAQLQTGAGVNIGAMAYINKADGGSYTLGNSAGLGQAKVTFAAGEAESGTTDFTKSSVAATAATKLGESMTDATVGGGLNVSNQASASKSITTIQSAIETVSAERSKLGAYQNRLEHTIANLGTSSENLTAAESRIRDVDMAKEMSTFSKNNILAQAAQSMLAQANQQPQQVLQLLQ